MAVRCAAAGAAETEEILSLLLWQKQANMQSINAANVFVLPFCDAIKGKKPSLWYG
jgi:hypothetical protein